MWRVFTAQYGLSPYITRLGFVLEGLRTPKDYFGVVNHFVEELETIIAVTLAAVTENASLRRMVLGVQRAQSPLCLRHCCLISAAVHLWNKKSGNMEPMIRNSAAGLT